MPQSRKRRDDEPVVFLVDRSLGRHQLPEAIRELGYEVHTLQTVYGEQRAQRMADEDWLRDAGRNGWTVLTKDERVRQRAVELDAVRLHKVKMFCLTSRSLTGQQQVERFVYNINRIIQASRKQPPWIYGVYDRQIRRLWP